MTQTSNPAPIRKGAIDQIASAANKIPRRPPKAPREPGKDRWGLDPPRRGWFRGQIFNVSIQREQTVIGQLLTYEFDLYPDDEAAPALPCRMQGYTFSKDPRDQILVETYVGSTLPTERLNIEVLKMVWDPDNDIRGHRPVEKYQRITSTGLGRAIFFMMVPGAIIALVAWSLHYYFQLF